MRTHIDYGIYFNSDFCQIARMEECMPVIKKSSFMKDSLPLCVAINKKQDILVGDTACNVLKSNKIIKHIKFNSDCFTGFSQTLGTTYSYESLNASRSFSSEELLAECFKQLKSFISDEIINSVVITVPDKFINPQNEAVIRAGELAGFKQIELVQESIAASLGYGLGSKHKDSFWLIFDFGGSTFHVTLIKAEEGILTVKDTDGDNWLGGKNLDEAIVDQIIIPNLQEKFAIKSVLEDADKKEILRDDVKYYAEEAKKRLSTNEAYTILSNVGALPFEDENGAELEIDIEITRQDLAWVSRPIYQKAIDITIDLLKRNNLKGKDIDAICLVGGDTYSPVLRKMLKEQITDKVDTSVDPMTAVAKGAALFASTLSVSSEVLEASRDKTKLQLEIKYEATTVEMDEMVSVKVLKEKSTGTFPEKIYADIVRFDGTWSSGRKLIGEKATIVDVLIVEQPNNLFKINTYDEFANQIECEPNQFTILYGLKHLDGKQVLPYHIGIAKYFFAEHKGLFMPIKGLEKNKQLPAIGVINGFKTRFDIRPGFVNDIIRIPIYQGDYNAEGTNPLLNILITEIVISGESLPAMLPEGSDVDITIKVDRSEGMQFSAYFPLLNHTEELKIEIKKPEPPTEELLTKEISKAKRAAQKVNADDISKKLEALEEQLEKDGGSADGKLKIQDGLRKELLKLDNAEKTAEWPRVEQELKDAFYEMEISSSNEAQISESRFTIERILKEKNIRDAKLMLFEINNFNTSATISDKYIDNLKGELVLFYAYNPSMGKERFRFHLGELIRIENNKVGEDDKVKVTDLVKKELLKWK